MKTIAGILVGSSALAQLPGNFSTLSTTGTATLNGDVLMCSGRPWIDVRCHGAVGDGGPLDRSCRRGAAHGRRRAGVN